MDDLTSRRNLGIAVAVIAVILIAACTSRELAPAPTTTAAPTPTIPVPATVAPSSTPSAGTSNSDLIAKGKLIFEKTAGGVGCAYCHGLDGKGNGTSGAGAPDIRGASEAKARAALAGGAPLMSFIDLSEDELAAVLAYLQYLLTQP